MRPRVVIMRGHQANPWELRPWAELADRFDVSLPAHRLQRVRRRLAAPAEPRARRPCATASPAGRSARWPPGVVGERYLADADAAYAEADVVHAGELSFWFTADAARRKARHGYKLVTTVWETLPVPAGVSQLARPLPRRGAGRHRPVPPGHRAGARVAAAGGRGPPAGSRSARRASTPALRPVLHPAGRARDPLPGPAGLGEGPPGRAARRGAAARATAPPRVRIVGRGPEEGRLRAYADELGLGDRVEIGARALRADARGVRHGLVHGAGEPAQWFWEEQFGMVLAEAMAASLPGLRSGAIPEVLGSGRAFSPGDWPGLAERLVAGPLARRPASACSTIHRSSPATASARRRSASPTRTCLCSKNPRRGERRHGRHHDERSPRRSARGAPQLPGPDRGCGRVGDRRRFDGRHRRDGRERVPRGAAAPQRGLAWSIYQRTAAASLVSSRVIVSIDDDARLVSPRTIEQTLEDFDHPRIGAVAIPYVDVRRGGTRRQQPPDHEQRWITDTFIGTAHALLREPFLDLGGYRTSFGTWARSRSSACEAGQGLRRPARKS